MAKRIYTQAFPTVNAVIEKDGKFLLVKEGAIKGPEAGSWNLPGGWIENENDDPITAIIREVGEETGLDFRPNNIVGIFSLEKSYLKDYRKATPHPIRIIFSGESSGEVNPKFKDEISEAKWFSYADFPKIRLRDDDIMDVIGAYLSGHKFPLSMIHHKVQE